MKCPKCKEEIGQVMVISEITQLGLLEGKVIIDYDSDVQDPIGKTLRIECPECGKNITKFVKEK